MTAPGILRLVVRFTAKNAKIRPALDITTKSDFVFAQPRPTADGGPTEILHCTSPDLGSALRYAASLPSGGDLMELDQLKRRGFFTLLGGAITWPLAARAQQSERMQRVGFLSGGSESDPENQSWAKGFVQRLEELGWVNGRNLRIDTRFGEADATHLSMLAAELVELGPRVILASGGPAAFALRQHTLSIPIVFAQVADPVSAGFVTNLARPEGNITGFTNFEFSVGGKWLQLLKECAPSTDRIAVVFDPANPTWAAYLRTIEAAAPSFGLRLIPAGLRNADEITERFAAFARDPNGALVVLPSSLAVQHRRSIIGVAAMHRLPAVYPFRVFTVDGGLMSYGTPLLDLYIGAASYVDRILRGAKVAELPIQLPTKYG
jgi:putative ABC transport system substrate-binding protein